MRVILLLILSGFTVVFVVILMHCRVELLLQFSFFIQSDSFKVEHVNITSVLNNILTGF